MKIKQMGIGDILSNALIIIIALFFLYPLFWLFTNSIKLHPDIVKIPPEIIPSNPTMRNFVDVFVKRPAGRWLFNSIYITTATTLVTVVLSSMAAYSFAKLQFFGKKVLFVILIASIMMPIQVLIVPLFVIVRNLGWHNSYIGVILPPAAMTFGVFLLTQFFRTLPDSLRESAKLDGCSEWRIFLSIILPLGKAGIGALFIITFVRVWNDYLWQMIILGRQNLWTLMVGIARMQIENDPNYGYRVAGIMVAAIPMLIIFLSFQKYFTKGVVLGAEKG